MNCTICHNDGKCPNHDIYDCVEYLEVKEGKPKGQWMVDWMKRLQKRYKEPYESNFVKWSKQFVSIIIIIILCVSCEDIFPNQVSNDESIYVYIDPRLPKDENGYYHLNINRGRWQTIHRFSGLVTDENDNPLDVVRFEWTSNLYWVLGDTLGYIVHRGLTDDMVYVSYDTTYITGFNGMEVPTINPACYSNSKGEFNQMGGFVRSMIGDTATIEISYGIREVSGDSEIIKFCVVLD